MLREIYEQYLINLGHQPSGVVSYVRAVERIVKRENLTWDTLANDIGNIVRKYDRGGSEEEFGSRSKRTYISALRRFQEMLANMPAFTPS